MRRLALLLMLTGCIDLSGPIGLTGAVRFIPSDTGPNTYGWQWDRMTRCAGIEADFRRVKWYYFPGPAKTLPSWVTPGRSASATWLPPHTIYLTERMRPEPFTVSHEILHDLLGGPMLGDSHPAEYFIRRCGYELAVPGALPH